MAGDATMYFDNITAGSVPADWQQWEIDILRAEAERCNDPTTMDILAARTVWETSGENGEEGAAPVTSVNEWLALALHIEERQ